MTDEEQRRQWRAMSAAELTEAIGKAASWDLLDPTHKFALQQQVINLIAGTLEAASKEGYQRGLEQRFGLLEPGGDSVLLGDGKHYKIKLYGKACPIGSGRYVVAGPGILPQIVDLTTGLTTDVAEECGKMP